MLGELETISTAVCVFLDWDDAHLQLAERIVEAGCALKVIIVREEPTTRPLTNAGLEVVQYTPVEISRGAVTVL